MKYGYGRTNKNRCRFCGAESARFGAGRCGAEIKKGLLIAARAGPKGKNVFLLYIVSSQNGGA